MGLERGVAGEFVEEVGEYVGCCVCASLGEDLGFEGVEDEVVFEGGDKLEMGDQFLAGFVFLDSAGFD